MRSENEEDTIRLHPFHGTPGCRTNINCIFRVFQSYCFLFTFAIVQGYFNRTMRAQKYLFKAFMCVMASDFTLRDVFREIDTVYREIKTVSLENKNVSTIIVYLL